MMQGTVKWFNDLKGFGFIEPQGGGEDIFAHFSAIQMDGFRTLKQGAEVTFEITDGPKGKLAQNIRTVGSPTPSNQDGSSNDEFAQSGESAPMPLQDAA